MLMIKRFLLFYFLVFTIPLFLGLLVWQSNRYQNLSRELTRLEQTQAEWIESNKRLIAGIGEYSSPQRIEDIARNQLNLQKIPPEYLLQVKIMGGTEHGY
jgi:cell division protein FtsL